MSPGGMCPGDHIQERKGRRWSSWAHEVGTIDQTWRGGRSYLDHDDSTAADGIFGSRSNHGGKDGKERHENGSSSWSASMRRAPPWCWDRGPTWRRCFSSAGPRRLDDIFPSAKPPEPAPGHRIERTAPLVYGESSWLHDGQIRGRAGGLQERRGKQRSPPTIHGVGFLLIRSRDEVNLPRSVFFTWGPMM